MNEWTGCLGFCLKATQLEEMNTLIGITASTIDPYHNLGKLLLASL